MNARSTRHHARVESLEPRDVTRTRARTRRGSVLLLALSACGTLAAPSHGDTDLPTAITGPFTQLDPTQTPSGSSTLIAAEGGLTATEPCVITRGMLREAYVTLWQGVPGDAAARRSIGRVVEGAPRSLRFDAVREVFTAAAPWESGSVGAPHALVESDGSVLLVYEAAGRIGLARAADGVSFTRRPEPILVPDGARGEAATLRAPSIARAPDGAYWLAYASGGQIFVAHASSAEGPYTRVGPVLSPRTDPTLSGGDGGALGFEAIALDDPALAIEQTAAGRAAFYLFYTALGPVPATTGPTVPVERIGLAGSFDGSSWSRTPRAVFQPRSTPSRAGSLDRVDDRTALLWLTTGTGRATRITAALGPLVPRVGASVPR